MVYLDRAKSEGNGDVLGEVVAALEPLAVDRLSKGSFQCLRFVHAAFDTVPEAEGEAQPLVGPDGRNVLIGTVRLDNLAELRRKLPADLPSRSDAEVLLSCYDVWDQDLLHRIRGDFSFVIWDSRRRRVFAARDHLGVRPLCYAGNDELLVIGTTVAGVLAHPDVSRSFDDEYVAQFLASELTDEGRTPWAAVRRLAAGQWLSFDSADRHPRVRTYWSPCRSPVVRDATPEDLVELRRLVDDSVIARTRALGPLACEVSGGLDSSMVTAIASRLGGSNGPTVGVTLTLPGRPEDESRYADSLATHLRLPLHQFPIGRPSDPSVTAKITRTLRSPLLIVSGEAEQALAAFVRSQGARVLLTGHGGDQLFALTMANLIEALRHPHRDRLADMARTYYGSNSWARSLARDLLVPSLPAVDSALHYSLPSDCEVRRTSTEKSPARWRADRAWREYLLNGHSQVGMDQSHVADALRRVEGRHLSSILDWWSTSPPSASGRATISPIETTSAGSPPTFFRRPSPPGRRIPITSSRLSCVAAVSTRTSPRSTSSGIADLDHPISPPWQRESSPALPTSLTRRCG